MSQVASPSTSWNSQSAQACSARVQQALAKLAAPSPQPRWHGKKTIIYGAGVFGRDVASALLQQNVTVLGFLDQKGAGQPVLGDLRAYPPDSPEAKRWLAEKPVALICTHNYKVCLREIARLLTQLGFEEIVTPMEIYLHLGEELGWRYWLGTKDVYAKEVNRINLACGLWADAQSERLFLETLLLRVAFDLNALTEPSTESVQYADPTVPRWEDPLRMVDGGAFTGDTLRSLLGHGYRFEAIHAFEPDLGNFRKLRDSVADFAAEPAISLWPCGISSKTARLTFSEVGGVASKLSETGAAQIPVVALDDVLHGQSVNLIKLDIEGAEPDALQGARRVIEKYRPGLAVCLYHFPHHLWTIPLWVANLDLGYRLYYRVHAQSSYETVLYAIPS